MTVAPPVVRALPAWSRAVKVAVILEPEATDAFDRVTVDIDAAMGPTVTVSVGKDVEMGAPVIVAPMLVAVPATCPVNRAE